MIASFSYFLERRPLLEHVRRKKAREFYESFLPPGSQMAEYLQAPHDKDNGNSDQKPCEIPAPFLSEDLKIQHNPSQPGHPMYQCKDEQADFDNPDKRPLERIIGSARAKGFMGHVMNQSDVGKEEQQQDRSGDIKTQPTPKPYSGHDLVIRSIGAISRGCRRTSLRSGHPIPPDL